MVLRRRWSDLAHSFASVPLLGCIPSICAAGELVATLSSRYGGRCLPWLEGARFCEQKNRAGKGPGRNLHVTHSISSEVGGQGIVLIELAVAPKRVPKKCFFCTIA